MALSPSSSKVAVGVVLPSANRLRARVIPRFPANLVAGNGITIIKNGQIYTISVDTNFLVDGDKGDITVSGGGLVWEINDGAVAVEDFQDIAQASFFSRATSGVGPVEVVTSAGATALLQLFTDSLQGLVPGSGGGSTKFLRADGQWSPVGRGEDIVTLTDQATVDLDASLGNMFKLVAAGNRTIGAPLNKPAAGESQRIIIIHEASGANRTLFLIGGAGGFRFGSDITGLTATTSGTIDYIGAIYNPSADRWDVVSYVKGF